MSLQCRDGCVPWKSRNVFHLSRRNSGYELVGIVTSDCVEVGVRSHVQT
jgi:hypothetical protein